GPGLEWEQAGGVGSGERRDRGRDRADGGQLTERRVCPRRVAVRHLSPAEVIPVIEDIEALALQQDSSTFRRLYATLDEESHLGGSGASERRFADDCSVDDRAIIVRAIAVVVDTSSSVEGTRRRKLYKGACGYVKWQIVVRHNHRAMPLVKQARSALYLAEPGDVAIVGANPVAVRFSRVGRLR